MSEVAGGQLLGDRTTLYRDLLDETCQNAGKSSRAGDDVTSKARIKGDELRTMLQHTAVAITVYGNESIPFEEPDLRLIARIRKRSNEENGPNELQNGFVRPP
jgi:hypothetical protein